MVGYRVEYDDIFIIATTKKYKLIEENDQENMVR